MILLARENFETCYQHFDAYFAGAPNLAKFKGGCRFDKGGGYKKIRIFTR